MSNDFEPSRATVRRLCKTTERKWLSDPGNVGLGFLEKSVKQTTSMKIKTDQRNTRDKPS